MRCCAGRFPLRWLRTMLPLLALMVALFANALTITNVLPYGPFMIKHFGLTSDDRELGRFAGFLLTTYMLGSLLASYKLGMLADTRGRRFVIIFGLLACIVPQLGFGMASDLFTALAFRFFGGLTNGIAGAAKAAAPEIVPPRWQAFAISMIGGMWGLGNVAGPVLGGLLAEDPDRPWPEGSLFSTFPFLLPNLVCASFSVLALALTWRFLPETLPGAARSASSGCCCAPRNRKEITGATAVLQSTTKSDEVPAEDTPSSGSGSVTGGGARAPAALSMWASIRGTPRSALPPVFSYCFIALNEIMYSECFPLLCVAPPCSGGLGADASETGALLSFAGLGILLCQFLVMPTLARIVPVKRIFVVGNALMTVFYALPPILVALVASGTATTCDEAGSGSDGEGGGEALSSRMFVVLATHAFLLRFVASAVFTSSFILTNNSVPTAHRGRVNGLAMALSAAFRAVGPAFAGLCFSWSLTNGLAAPLDIHLTFYAVALLSAATALYGATHLPSSLNKPPTNTEASGTDAGGGGAAAKGGLDLPECKPVPATAAAPVESESDGAAPAAQQSV